MTDDDMRQSRHAPAEHRIAELEDEVDELRSANEILLSVAAYFSNTGVPPTPPGTSGTLAASADD
ncbi:hypothetical protein GCM10010387_19960 [Streptomyces inusitatus]|uniref:Transposase n=1 Tax=Streptomyces inusitatus TaxID=68221 RepID=A0A918PXW8_9ACTN|nr:hypothetical protein [Streptomyces inusitatus]GGZ26634.1 hypothetical protein GCM10010387_19960 [Streptomyces inusitatus]